MQDPYFFGYGSLVNAATHAYTTTHPAQLTGWKRVWRHTSLRELAFLSVTPADGFQIDGLVAEVPNSDWHALDLRETGYFRSRLPETSLTHGAGAVDVHMYQTHPEHLAPPDQPHPILLSYLDVVVQGFLRVFGEDGVEQFFDTTDGWAAPILNDRVNPLYPRHQVLTPQETELVDSHLADRKVHFILA
ncbi:gamma-glutamyl AIG2-like cyclotransferase [Litoreibacter meonggei]|uniref:Gamma-glutamyl AIG2-like cyclotransferase n=1 Tax=Litoreibacter meonggei TaxID=1049199 RepID=A0A497WEZ7_9RHOB|nr:gamma-glutamylcyclotransferase family protein [Litoreibacter meonggei]RLJ51688.1 gamma-glutamyl AIG2-like cyclotransferase [Litoreibacter meonggei]